MAHKICAALHALIALGLFGVLGIFRASSDADFCGLLILAATAATIGCWTRRRWLVAAAGAPLMIGGVAAFAIGDFFNKISGSNEMGFLMLIGILVWILEIVSFLYAKKPAETPPANEPEQQGTSIVP